MIDEAPRVRAKGPVRPVRLGFLGVGWIGRQRMQAMIETGLVDAAAVADPSGEMAEAARRLAPGAVVAADLDAMLDLGLDGVVIATPSAMHAEQALKALDAGVAVFCQKPLGRTAAEAASVVEAARRADRRLGLDLSYRHTEAMSRLRERVRLGDLGDVFAVDLTFHNAYGPDKQWFYDRRLSGGGCVMDLGVHLVDLALWALDFPKVESVVAKLMRGGRPFVPDGDGVEDYAVAMLTLASGTVVRLACSWRLQAGCDAEIAAAFYGTRAGAAARNVGGSFYDFVAERLSGAGRETLCEPPDAWGGRAGAAWALALAADPSFDPEALRYLESARVLDRIYAAAIG